jgi:hypothetical protein
MNVLFLELKPACLELKDALNAAYRRAMASGLLASGWHLFVVRHPSRDALQ